MNVTLEQAVRIYARAMCGWFGPSAVEKSTQKIIEFAARGDIEGVAVYERVSAEIARLQATSNSPQSWHSA